jgi:hypothetical protein
MAILSTSDRRWRARSEHFEPSTLIPEVSRLALGCGWPASSSSGRRSAGRGPISVPGTFFHQSGFDPLARKSVSLVTMGLTIERSRKAPGIRPSPRRQAQIPRASAP